MQINFGLYKEVIRILMQVAINTRIQVSLYMLFCVFPLSVHTAHDDGELCWNKEHCQELLQLRNSHRLHE